MKTIHAYVGGSFLASFIITFLVFTFVMTIGVIFGASEYISRGIPLGLLLKLVGYGVPTILPYTIPFSLLTASLLVFGRFSADGEITAMKACGISLWQIVTVPLMIGMLVTLLCVHVTHKAIPGSHFARRQLLAKVGVETPADLLPEGQFTREFPGLAVRVDRKRGNQLFGIRIYDQRTRGIKREIRAERGTVRRDENGRDVLIDLEQVTISPLDDGLPGSALIDRWPVKIVDAGQTRRYEKRKDDLTILELLASIQEKDRMLEAAASDDVLKERTWMAVELNKRLALSAACFVFVFLGIPLGIRTHRKESSIGVALSLLVVLGFYMFIVIAESLAKHPSFLPHLIIWIPVLLAMILGARLMRRAN